MKIIAIFLILAAIVTAITAVSTMSSAALASKTSGSNGLETADENVHTNTPGGPKGQQDINFHTGTCQGGHTTEVLQSLGGCSILQSPSELGSGHNGK
jgi:hypothetical protein